MSSEETTFIKYTRKLGFSGRENYLSIHYGESEFERISPVFDNIHFRPLVPNQAFHHRNHPRFSFTMNMVKFCFEVTPYECAILICTSKAVSNAP